MPSKKIMKKLLFAAAFFGVCLFASGSSAQQVRLRSNINPTCTGSTTLKFADIFGDGNIAVQGTYNCRGVFIYDISNPDAPVVANHYSPIRPGTASTTEQFLEAIVIGNRGYFGSGNGGGVYIVDLTNPSSPQLLNRITTTTGNGFNSIHEMVVFDQNGSRFLVENFNGTSNKILKVINVTDPLAPVFVRDITPSEPQWVHAMVVRGNRMYTSGWGNSANRGRTEIWDVSNITTQQPIVLGFVQDSSASTTAGNSMHSAWPSEDGNYLYSAREIGDSNAVSPGDIRVYDITNPA